MNTLEFTEFQKNLGFNQINTKMHHWIVLSNKLAISTPSLENSKPNKKEISELFKKGIKAVSFTVDMDEKNSYEYIYKGSDYSLEVFSSKIRNQIRKGLKSCEIRKPSAHDLKTQAVKINREILSKHERDVDYLTNDLLWSKYSQNLLETKDVYTYGAYVNEILVGYLFFIKVNNKYYVYHPYASREYSKECPMNALLFTAINDFIKNDKEVSVSYGLASFFEKHGLDHFKKGMLFMEKPITRLMAFSPFINLFFNDIALKILSLFSKKKNISIKYTKYKVLLDANKLYKKYMNDNTKI